MSIEFENKKVFFSGKSINFDFDVQNVLVIDDKFVIVLLQIPYDSNALDNICAFDINGNLLWTVQSITEAFSELKMPMPFEGVALLPNGNLSASDFNGINFEIDIHSGKLISHKIAK